MEEDNKQDKNQQAAGSYLAIGICFGVAFGIIFDNLAVWMCLGVGIGLLAPSFLKTRHDHAPRNAGRRRKTHGLGIFFLNYADFAVFLHLE